MVNKEVLDPCCGSRMFYFDKDNSLVQYCDIRSETHTLCDGRILNVCPEKIIDYRNLEFSDETFRLVVFDPPHLVYASNNSWLAKKYGNLSKETWRDDIAAGFSECWRVLKNGGTLVFKWNETQLKISELLSCLSIKPLLGHTTKHNLKTHWMLFYKPE